MLIDRLLRLLGFVFLVFFDVTRNTFIVSIILTITGVIGVGLMIIVVVSGIVIVIIIIIFIIVGGI